MSCYNSAGTPLEDMSLSYTRADSKMLDSNNACSTNMKQRMLVRKQYQVSKENLE